MLRTHQSTIDNSESGSGNRRLHGWSFRSPPCSSPERIDAQGRVMQRYAGDIDKPRLLREMGEIDALNK